MVLIDLAKALSEGKTHTQIFFQLKAGQGFLLILNYDDANDDGGAQGIVRSVNQLVRAVPQSNHTQTEANQAILVSIDVSSNWIINHIWPNIIQTILDDPLANILYHHKIKTELTRKFNTIHKPWKNIEMCLKHHSKSYNFLAKKIFLGVAGRLGQVG